MAINTEPDIHKLVICANVFIRKNGKYLLLKRSGKKKFAPGVVHPFGGKIELGENPIESAQREVLEETGLKVNNLRLEAVILEIFPVSVYPTNWLIFHFSADYEQGELVKTDEGEAVWLPPQSIREQKLFPSVKKTIDYILNPDDGTVFASFKYNSDGTEIIEEKIQVSERSRPIF